MSDVIRGTCLCGQIEFDVHEPQTMGVCHCTRCQRWNGGPGSTLVRVATNDFQVTKGQDLMKQYHEEGFRDRYFCSHCGSSVYIEADGGEGYYVSAGGLQDLKLKPAWHIQVADKAIWDEIGGDAPQFPQFRPD